MLVFTTYRESHGFSLVELVISMAIFGILSIFAIPAYRTWTQNSLTRNAAESIRTGIQIARAEALKRNAPVQFDFRGSDSAWTVCLRPATPGSCPNPDDTTTVQSRGVKEGSSANVDIELSLAAPYVFNTLGMLASPTSSVSIEVKNGVLSSTDARNLRVVIGAGGGVRVCDPKVSDATDPRAC